MTQHRHQLDRPTLDRLLAASRSAVEHAYCPYSQFPVGAALLCSDGSVYTGCNIENAAYSMAICAERTAVGKAISEGRREFVAIAVTTNMVDEFGSPCGNCRQFMSEFGDFDVYLVKPDLTYKKTTIGELLPMAFGPKSLTLERMTNFK